MQAKRLGHGVRLPSIDMLRGIAVVLMVLGNSRVYFGQQSVMPPGRISIPDVNDTDLGNFIISWIVSASAPIFVLLAGMGAYLRLLGSETKRDVARFLALRGLLLIAIDIIVVPILKWFYFDPSHFEVGALWAIGWGMIALSGLLYFRIGLVAIVGLVIVVGHNALDQISFDGDGLLGSLTTILFRPGRVTIGQWLAIQVNWPILPWLGVMACGFAMGELYRLPVSMRRTMLRGIGLNLIFMFAILRAFGFYGDPNPWQSGDTFMQSAMSYLNCTKHPPSLCFLLMTLGPALAWLGWIENRRSPKLEKLATLGCVPLFCYLGHWLVLHTLALAVMLGRGLPTCWLFSLPHPDTGRGVGWQADFAVATPLVLVIGAATVVFLYLSARRYARIKFFRRPRWASYL